MALDKNIQIYTQILNVDNLNSQGFSRVIYSQNAFFNQA